MSKQQLEATSGRFCLPCLDALLEDHRVLEGRTNQLRAFGVDAFRVPFGTGTGFAGGVRFRAATAGVGSSSIMINFAGLARNDSIALGLASAALASPEPGNHPL